MTEGDDFEDSRVRSPVGAAARAFDDNPGAQRPSFDSFVAVRHRAIDLRRLCTSVLERLDALASARHVSLESAQFATRAWGDEGILDSVLSELLAHCVGQAMPRSTLTLMTTPRKRATELRIVTWELDTRSSLPRAARMGARTRDLASHHELGDCALAIAALGGSGWVENAGAGSALCMRLPNVR